MAILNTYISEKFLEEFLESRPKNILSSEYYDWIKLYQFLFSSKTKIIFQDDKENFVKWLFEDALVLELFDRYYQGDDNIKFEKWENDLPSNIFTNFLIHSSKISLEENLIQKGLPYAKNDKSETLHRLLAYKVISISKNAVINQLNKWDDLQANILPFHSMIIADNYLLEKSDYFDGITYSIKPLLEMLLCDNNRKEITLICSNVNNSKNRAGEIKIEHENRIKKEKIEKFEQLKANFNELKAYLKYNIEKSDSKLSLIVLNNQKEFHDRVIITNSQYFTSGNSFTQYFNKEGKINLHSPTLFTIFSHIHTDNNVVWAEIANNVIEYLSDKIKECENIYNEEEKSFINRLLQ